MVSCASLGPLALNWPTKETSAQLFYCQFLENFKNTSFTEQLRVRASVAAGIENSVEVFIITIHNFKKKTPDDLRYLACF